MNRFHRPRTSPIATVKRVLIHLALLVLLAAILAACGAEPGPVEQLDAAADAPAAAEVMAEGEPAREAPDLAASVAAGELPPLEERLPLEPMVVEPVESIGQYGGVWRSALMGGQDNA